MNKKDFEDYCKAGEILKKTKEYIKERIKKELFLIEIAELIEDKIKELGGELAFPVNLSLNEIAAHYTPSFEDKTKAEGLLKIDMGVEVNGCIADSAFSIDLTEDKRYEEMIKLNRKILDETILSLNLNSRVCDVGNKIYSLLKGKKFNIIKNLTGHCLERYLIHASPSISNVPNENQTLLKDKAIAIEPFLTTGVGEVIEGKLSEIFMLVEEKKVRDNETRKLLDFIIKEYKTKPFCKRWLIKKGFKTNFPLQFLVKEKILYNFPILIEKSRGIVSQEEETVVFFENKVVVTTK